MSKRKLLVDETEKSNGIFEKTLLNLEHIKTKKLKKEESALELPDGMSLDMFARSVQRMQSIFISSWIAPPETETKVFAASDFSLAMVVNIFGLKYKEGFGNRSRHMRLWDIEAELKDRPPFPLTHCIKSLLGSYAMNFDRSSEAVCRTALDFILNESLTVIKGGPPEEDGEDEVAVSVQKPNIFEEKSDVSQEKHDLVEGRSIVPEHKRDVFDGVPKERNDSPKQRMTDARPHTPTRVPFV